MGRIKTVSSGGSTNTYTYDGDNLKTIVSPSTTYTFAYNEWGEQSSVKVGSSTLVSYGYTNDAERQIASLTYGNGQSISHTYNSKKQLTGTKFNTDTSNRFTYTYNSDGTMATKVDVKSGILTKFKEDGTVEEWNSAGTTLLHSYTYDDDGNFIEKVGNVTTKSEFYSSEDDLTSGVKIGSLKNETTKDKFEREISNKSYKGKVLPMLL